MYGLLLEVVGYFIVSVLAHELMHLIAVMLLEPENFKGFVVGFCKYGLIACVHLSRPAQHLISYLSPQLLNLLFLLFPMWLAVPLISANVAGGMLDLCAVIGKGKEVRLAVYGVYIRRDLKVLVGKF